MEIGEGADFFLCKKGCKKLSFQQNPVAKLEVSGIWNEKLGNTINIRINIKKRQVEKGIIKMPIFIIVVEFGKNENYKNCCLSYLLILSISNFT